MSTPGYNRFEDGPGHPPPSYQTGQERVAIRMPESANQPRWSWCPMVTAVFGFFCCTIFGLVAMLAAVTSYVDHKSKDFARSANKRKLAYGFGIAAIALGCFVVLVVLIELIIEF